MTSKGDLKKIFELKTERRESTNDAYSQRLAGLIKRFGLYKETTFENTDFLKEDQEGVLHWISAVPNNRKDAEGNYQLPSVQTQVGYLNPIIEYLKLIDEHSVAEDYKKFKELCDDKLTNSYKNGEGITKVQKSNIISYEDLVDYMRKIDEDILIYKNKGLLSANDNWILEDLETLKIILRLYVLHPSRNEYASLKFITLRDYKKIKQPEFNYVVLSQRKNFLSITNYKTSDSYGVKIIDITDKLLLRMLKSLKVKREKEGKENLFYLSKTGQPYDNHNISAIMTKYSKKLIGKSIGTTLLYKIVIKEAGLSYEEALKNDDNISAIKFNEILKKFAKTRGHSQHIQKAIYVDKSHLDAPDTV